MLCQGGDKEDILVLQGDISHRASEDALQVDGDDLLRAVGLQAAKYRLAGHRLFGQA